MLPHHFSLGSKLTIGHLKYLNLDFSLYYKWSFIGLCNFVPIVINSNSRWAMIFSNIRFALFIVIQCRRANIWRNQVLKVNSASLNSHVLKDGRTIGKPNQRVLIWKNGRSWHKTIRTFSNSAQLFLMNYEHAHKLVDISRVLHILCLLPYQISVRVSSP